MVILHINEQTDDACSGVNVAVPHHVRAQSDFAETALWNTGTPVSVEGVKRVFTAASIDELPAPFNSPDAAVFHNLYIPRYLSIAKQLRERGIPYFIVPHGALKKSAQQKSRFKKMAANLLLFKRFVNGAAGVQCLTEKEKAESVMGKRIFVAPNGVNPPAQTKTAFHTDCTRFVYVGRILPSIKGLDLMINAFVKQKALMTDNRCTLDIYGPCEDRGVSYLDEMNGTIQSGGVEGMVTLHPAVLGEEKARVLLDADVFMQTSRTEGMPLGVLEALSYGLPCLLTEGTTFAQTVASRGAGWNAGSDVDAIAAALRQSVADRSRFPLFSANAVAVSREHDWHTAAQTAIENYRRCLTAR